MSGGALPGYLTELLNEPEARHANPARYMQLEVGNDKDYIATRISHKLNLTGPSRTIQTACSSSLVCISDAVDSIRAGKCDMAIAGGAHVAVPQGTGYKYQPGMIWSPDGFCRPFDAAGQGTYECSAAGVVLLKPEADLSSTDTVYAVIRGVAVNNDGAQKAGYWAPSVMGQAAVVRAALLDSGLDASAVQYIECHATGTPLGDPVEIAALTKAHQAATNSGQMPPCVLGSVKSNVGHAGAAAGVLGFIKMALCLHYKQIPPTVHFKNANPKMNLEATRFSVQHSEAADWTRNGGVERTAAVSAFGIGGTNVHLVAQEYVTPQTARPPASEGSKPVVLLLSAMSQAALITAEEALAKWLQVSGSSSDLRDVERTLISQRRHCRFRKALVYESTYSSSSTLQLTAGSAEPASTDQKGSGQVVLVLAAISGSLAAKTSLLAKSWPEFATAVHKCYAAARGGVLSSQFEQFVFHYSLVTALLSCFKLKVGAIAAEGVGHLAAAVVAEIIPLSIAVQLIQSAAQSSSATESHQLEAVYQPEVEAESAKSTAESGSDTDDTSRSDGTDDSNLSSSMNATNDSGQESSDHDASPIDASLEQSAAFYRAAADKSAIRVLSSTTLQDLSTIQASDSQYWLQSLTQPVDLTLAVQKAKSDLPGAAIFHCAKAILENPNGLHWQDVLDSVGSLWCAGARVDWKLHLASQAQTYTPCAVALPLYQFDRVRCWPDTLQHQAQRDSPTPNKMATPLQQAELFYHTEWVPASPLTAELKPHRPRTPVWAVDSDSASLVSGKWPSEFKVCSCVRQAAQAAAVCGQLVLLAAGAENLAAVDPPQQSKLTFGAIELIQELVKCKCRCSVSLVVNGALQYASLWGLAKAVALELPELNLRRICWNNGDCSTLFDELSQPQKMGEDEVWLKNGSRLVPRLKQHTPLHQPSSLNDFPVLDARGSYLITGGKRGLGLEVAKYMVESMGAKHLVLVGRSPLSQDVAQLVAGWRSNGINVLEACVDVTDRQKLEEFWCTIEQQMAPLKGVIHCAGVVDDGIVVNLDQQRSDFVLAPKLAAWNVHSLCCSRAELDFMLLFSSTAAIWGTAGQSTYCAGNAFLDQLAEWRSAQGLPTVAIQWGGWGEVGMSVDLGITSQNGEDYLLPQQGLVAMHQILSDCLSTQPGSSTTDHQRAVAVINVQDKAKYLSDKSLFLTDHEPRVEIWNPLKQARPSQEHPLLGSLLESQCGDVYIWRQQFSDQIPHAEFLGDHTLDGAKIFPATGYMEMLLTACTSMPTFAANGTIILRDLMFVHPLQLMPGEVRTVHTIIETQSADSLYAGTARVTSRRDTLDPSSDAKWVVHATCQLATAATSHGNNSACNFMRLSDSASQESALALYHEFSESGFAYGPAFRGVKDLWYQPNGSESTAPRVVATVQPDPVTSTSAAFYKLHPATLDACSQIVSLVHTASYAGVPTSIEEVRIELNQNSEAMQSSTGYCAAAFCNDASVDVVIQALEPLACVSKVLLRGFELSSLAQVGNHPGLLYEHVWSELSESTKRPLEQSSPGVWLVLSTQSSSEPLSSAVTRYLQSKHCHVMPPVTLRSCWSVDMDPLLGAIEQTSLAGVLVCHTSGHDTGVQPECLWQLAQHPDLSNKLSPSARLWVISSSAAERGSAAAIETAGLHAAARSLQADAPVTLCSVIALPIESAVQPDIIAAACELITSENPPRHAEWRGSGLKTQKLAVCKHKTPPVAPISDKLAVPESGFSVQINPSRGLAGLQLKPVSMRAPRAGEVQIATDWWALNFRDVLIAIGAIPTETAGHALGMGGECIGRVAAVGEGVTGLTVGERVVGCPSDGFGSTVNVPASFVFAAPEELSDCDSVSVTMVYATAWLALKKLGHISAGETVLIHSAAGGVGLCAVHIALAAEAVVYCTASTPEKRDYLKSLGVAEVFNSRNTVDFVDGVKKATDGVGVDLVLNSLAGTAMVASIELLAPFGRFLEIGKRDQYESTRISLAPLLKGISVSAAHLDVLMIELPKVARQIMLDVWTELQAGRLPLLPSTSYPISELPAALQYMSEGKHIGKILVSMHPEEQSSTAQQYGSNIVCGPLNPATTWLALHSSYSNSDVVLITCGSGDSVQASQAREMIESTSVRLIECADGLELSTALKALQPITSIVHAAVTLCSPAALSLEVARVLHCAATAAGNKLLSFITLAPAVGGMLSGACQGHSHYDPRVTLNALLHELTATRALSEIKSVCVDVPKLTVPESGWHSCCSQEEQALTHSGLQRTALDQLWRELTERLAHEFLQGLSFAGFAGSPSKLQKASWSSTVLEQQRSGSTRSITSRIRECMVQFIATDSGLDPSDVDTQKPLEYYGLDSLSSLGLVSQLQSITPAASVIDLMQHSTIEALVRQLASTSSDHKVALRLLVLHGFRANKEIAQLQMQALLSAFDIRCDVQYMEAPHKATGPGDPAIPPEMALYEWWGEWDDTSDDQYEQAWKGPRYDGLADSVLDVEKYVANQGPFDGIVGFSQGAAVAGLVLARQNSKFEFGLLLSGVSMPWKLLNKTLECPAHIDVPTLHVYDESEEYVAEMEQLVSACANTLSPILHSEGHAIPKDRQVCKAISKLIGESFT